MTCCPKCQNEIDDGTCPHCGHDVASMATTLEGKFKFQFDLQFLFFLTTLTAVACAISKVVESWLPAPLIVVAALLFWRMRHAKRRCLIGMGLGFVSGMLLFAFVIPNPPNAPNAAGWVFIMATLVAIGAGLSAMGRKDYHRSGAVAIGAVAIYYAALGVFIFVVPR
jgi:hypothetical protein